MGTNTRMNSAIIIVAVAAVAASSAGLHQPSHAVADARRPCRFRALYRQDRWRANELSERLATNRRSNRRSIATFEHGNDSILFQIQRSVLNQTGQTVENLAQHFISNVQSNGSASLLENHSVSLGGLHGSAKLSSRSK